MIDKRPWIDRLSCKFEYPFDGDIKKYIDEFFKWEEKLSEEDKKILEEASSIGLLIY